MTTETTPANDHMKDAKWHLQHAAHAIREAAAQRPLLSIDLGRAHAQLQDALGELERFTGRGGGGANLCRSALDDRCGSFTQPQSFPGAKS